MSGIGGLFGSGSTNSVNYGGLYKNIEKYYPQLMAMMNQYLEPNAMAQAQAGLDVTQATAPQLNQLMTDLYKQYAPQLAAEGAQVGGQIQSAQAQNNANVANSSAGQAALAAAIAADKQANPEFYASRAAASSSLQNLLNADNSALNGNLSPTVTRAIDQSLARQNQQTGTLNAPSQANTVSNAMKYGQAGYNMQEQAKSDLSDALTKATSFLPASQSGVNSWNVATGGSNTTSQVAGNALNLFGGTTGTGTGTSGTSGTGNILNSMMGVGTGGTTNSNTGLAGIAGSLFAGGANSTAAGLAGFLGI